MTSSLNSLCFKKIASNFFKLEIFSLNGPAGISFPFPIQFSELKQANLRS